MKPHRCPKDYKAVWFSMFLLEAEHLCERKRWANISIQNKESLWTAGDNLISEVIDAPSGAQSCILLQIPAVQSQEEQQTCCSHSAVADLHHSRKSTTTCSENLTQKEVILRTSVDIAFNKEIISITITVQSIWEIEIILQLVSILYWMMCN